MDPQTPFEEKPKWSQKIKNTLGSIFGRQKNNTSPLAPEAPINTENTLTGLVKKALAFKNNRAEVARASSDLPFWKKRTLQNIILFLGIIFITSIAADLAGIFLERFIPEPPPSRLLRYSDTNRNKKSLNEYSIIISRNLFNRRGLIPGDELPNGDQNNIPIKTSLPLNLIGTLILKNEYRSIATIEDKDAKLVYPLRLDDEIPGKLKVLAIEPYKMIFINLGNSRREYVEIPDDTAKSNLSLAQGRTTKKSGRGEKINIEQLAPNQFVVAKNEIDKALAPEKFNEILTQARAIPHMENGIQSGFMLIQIVPGSIYDKLGLKDRDVICGFNGEPVNDAGKALELLGILKSASQVELCVKRDGKTSNFSYNFK